MPKDHLFKSMVLSGNILFALTDKQIIMVDRVELKPIKSLDFQVDSLMHPKTLINKVIYSDGDSMTLYNTNTRKVVYSFKNTVYNDQKVVLMQDSPIIGVIAVGYDSGLINLVNIEYDEIIDSYKD